MGGQEGHRATPVLLRRTAEVCVSTSGLHPPTWGPQAAAIPQHRVLRVEV